MEKNKHLKKVFSQGLIQVEFFSPFFPFFF